MAGLYLHIPFCSSKCSYCDFFSVIPRSGELDEYPHLLLRNLELLAAQETPSIDSIFFGGGTPSLLVPRQIGVILSRCRELFRIQPDCEISLEANPGTLSEKALHNYLQAGINRLSLGVQSFDDIHLQMLGRIHSAATAIDTCSAARSAGFDNLSLDLIFALPEQPSAQLSAEIAQVLELAPQHIGIYGLSIEEGTPLAQKLEAGTLSEVGEESYADSYLLLSRRLEAAGFEHYEISNFARPGFRCRHNQGYWQRNDCLAVGAGAHGFDSGTFGSRYAIPADLEAYRTELTAGRLPHQLLETFDRAGAMAETLYLALRTSDGLDSAAFENRFGTPVEQAFPRALERVRPYLRRGSGTLSLSLEGWLIYDHLISHFL